MSYFNTPKGLPLKHKSNIWSLQQIGDLFKFEYGRSLPDSLRSHGNFAVYGSSGWVSNHREALVDGPGIIVGRKGTIGAVQWSEDAFWPIDTTYYIVPQKALYLRWGYWLLNSLPLSNLDSSTGIPGLNRNDAYSLYIQVPPLPEQRRIAEILDTLDREMQKTEEVIGKLKQVRTGLVQDLLTRGIDEDGEIRDPVAHPELFKDSVLGKVPRGWEIDKLVNHISLPEGQVDPRRSPYRDWPLIAPDHIESQTGRLINVQTAAQQNAISGKYSFLPGDVLYSKIRPYLRKAVLANQEGLCSADMYPLRPKISINSYFLLATILGEHFSRFATVVSMRSGFPKINRRELGEYLLALPPYQEQQRIAGVLTAQDTRIHKEESHLNELRQIKRGLMEDLLTGRVRTRGDEMAREMAGVVPGAK